MKEDIYYVYINGEGKVKKFLPTTKLSERRKILNLLNNDNINKIIFLIYLIRNFDLQIFIYYYFFIPQKLHFPVILLNSWAFKSYLHFKILQKLHFPVILLKSWAIKRYLHPKILQKLHFPVILLKSWLFKPISQPNRLQKLHFPIILLKSW